MRARISPAPSRRQWLRRVTATAVSLPLVAGLVALLRREQGRQVPADVPIPADVPAGLSVVGAAIIFRTGAGTVRAWSARCTHLGCRIDRVAGDEAICPCHGSRYRSDGSVAAGPATRPLRPLTVVSDAGTGGWVARA
jgi:Rieske Fe-S protein